MRCLFVFAAGWRNKLGVPISFTSVFTAIRTLAVEFTFLKKCILFEISSHRSLILSPKCLLKSANEVHI